MLLGTTARTARRELAVDHDSGYASNTVVFALASVVMVVYLHEALNRRLATGVPLTNADIVTATIEGAVHRLRPKLMTVTVLLASLVPTLLETDIGSDVMKPIAAPIVGGMITPPFTF